MIQATPPAAALALLAMLCVCAPSARADEPIPADQEQRIQDLEKRLAEMDQEMHRLRAEAAEPAEEAGSAAQRSRIRPLYFAQDPPPPARATRNGEETFGGFDGRTDIGGVVQGPHAGFFGLSGPDDRFLLRPYVLLQLRHITASYEPIDTGDRSTDFGFEVSRAQVGIDGTVYSRWLYYRLQADAGAVDGSFDLQDAYVTFPLGLVAPVDNPNARRTALRVGQFKAPYAREWLVDEALMMAPEGSMVNQFLGGGRVGRVQGVSILYNPTALMDIDTDDFWEERDLARQFRAELAFHDGNNSANTSFLETGGTWGISGRVEYLLNGRWRDYRDMTARGTRSQLMVVGVGANWSQAGDTDFRALTVDVQWEDPGGMAAFGALVLAPERVDGDNVFNFGVVGQVSYLFNPLWEAFGRAELVVFDNDFLGADAEDTYPAIGAGLNRYLGQRGRWGHGAKFTVDAVLLPNGNLLFPVDGVISDEFAAMLRAQFQLAL